MKLLNIDELTVEQKIGQLLCVRGFIDEEDRAFVYEMIKKRSVGAVQIAYYEGCDKEIAKIKELADYPILICGQSESGFYGSKHRIPSMLALAATNNPELAYQIGCAIAIEEKKCGYNVDWSPNVDMVTKGARCRVPRVLGTDPHYVGKMANAIMQGYVENGVLGTAKHWPGGRDIVVDTHMEEGESELTEADILETDVIPYKYIMENAGLPGVMTKHVVYKNIDPDYPATLSKKVIDILRNQGFDGLLQTDSFAMMGILQKYSEKECYGLAIKAGNDLVLPNYRVSFKTSYNYLLDSYRRGVFTEERLNDAVRHVIKAQAFTMKEATTDTVSDYQIECFKRVAKEGICAITDDNVKAALSKETKKLFVILKGNTYKGDEIENAKETKAGAFITDNNIGKIKEFILDRFPGSEISELCEYPSPEQVEDACYKSTLVDEVIFITYVLTGAYRSSENLTEKITNLMNAIRTKVTTTVHLGNPYALEKIPHMKRIIAAFGGGLDCIENTIRVLNGEYEPTGIMPVKLDLN